MGEVIRRSLFLYTIHKEGRKILFVLGLLVIIANILLNQYYVGSEWLFWTLRLGSFGLFGFTLWFFRSPHFWIFPDSQVVLAPADGKVVAIEVVDENEYFNDKRLQVSIFMSPTNVHVNRNPISGRVKYTKYHPGNYLVAWHPKSSEKNERYTSVIEHAEMEVEILIRQVAGKVARKITNYLDEGQIVLQGKELGFIKFGSRVDIFFPLDAKLKIGLKDKVKGGKTVLVELPE